MLKKNSRVNFHIMISKNWDLFLKFYHFKCKVENFKKNHKYLEITKPFKKQWCWCDKLYIKLVIYPNSKFDIWGKLTFGLKGIHSYFL
jgi:hypothetical protein